MMDNLIDVVFSKTNYDKDFKVWQFSNTGEVPGINGFVDLDVLYLEG